MTLSSKGGMDEYGGWSPGLRDVGPFQEVFKKLVNNALQQKRLQTAKKKKNRQTFYEPCPQDFDHVCRYYL
jgi:hypothetical protein